MLRPLILLTIGIALISTACGGEDGLSENDVKNATYMTEALREGEATLEDGEFRAPAAPGSASEIVIQVDQFALGNLDDDGDEDAAVVLIEQTGGSGTFFSVHAVLNDDGETRDVSSQFLGDRIRIEAVAIGGGEVTVDFLDRPADAPFAEQPSVPVTKRFRLEGGKLIEVTAP